MQTLWILFVLLFLLWSLLSAMLLCFKQPLLKINICVYCILSQLSMLFFLCRSHTNYVFAYDEQVRSIRKEALGIEHCSKGGQKHKSMAIARKVSMGFARKVDISSRLKMFLMSKKMSKMQLTNTISNRIWYS